MTNENYFSKNGFIYGVSIKSERKPEVCKFYNLEMANNWLKRNKDAISVLTSKTEAVDLVGEYAVKGAEIYVY